MNETALSAAVSAAPPSSSMGLGRLLEGADPIALVLLVLLLALSVASWVLIAARLLSGRSERRSAARFLQDFWNASSLQAVAHTLKAQPARDPFARLATRAMDAQRHHRLHPGERLADGGGAEAFITRSLRQALDEEATQADGGLTALATIGSTAPFVGLFGTVWGIYHALLGLTVSGSATLQHIAGPVGEALVMTAIGLAVAVPALVAYNAFGRRNRVLMARLDGFAFELLNLLTTGRALQAPLRTDLPPAPARTASAASASPAPALPTAGATATATATAAA